MTHEIKGHVWTFTFIYYYYNNSLVFRNEQGGSFLRKVNLGGDYNRRKVLNDKSLYKYVSQIYFYTYSIVPSKGKNEYDFVIYIGPKIIFETLRFLMSRSNEIRPG